MQSQLEETSESLGNYLGLSLLLEKTGWKGLGNSSHGTNRKTEAQEGSVNCCAASTEHLVPASRYRAFPGGGKANFPLTNMLGAPLHSPTGGGRQRLRDPIITGAVPL